MTTPVPGVPSRPLQYIRAIANSGLPTTTRAVCWAIASFANNKTGKAWPSLRALSRATGLSTAIISKHTILAESRGYLHKQQRFNNSITYVITTPMPDEEVSPIAAKNETVASSGELWLRAVHGIEGTFEAP